MSDELIDLGDMDIVLLADRCAAAEAEVERLRAAMKLLAEFTDPEKVKPFHSPIGIARFVNQRARAALTPYNEGDPEPARVSPVPDTREAPIPSSTTSRGESE